LTSALIGGEWSASRPGRFIPREIIVFLLFYFKCLVEFYRCDITGVIKVKIKDNVTPVLNYITKHYGMKTHGGGVVVRLLHSYLTSAKNEGE
jgi:hypothetical protein